MKAGHRFAGGILIDQGTADKFLADQLKPELLVAACKAAGQEVFLQMREGYDHGYFFIQSFIVAAHDLARAPAREITQSSVVVAIADSLACAGAHRGIGQQVFAP